MHGLGAVSRQGQVDVSIVVGLKDQIAEVQPCQPCGLEVL